MRNLIGSFRESLRGFDKYLRLVRSAAGAISTVASVAGVPAHTWAQAPTESRSIEGHVDKIKRQEDGKLLVTGWGLDVDGKGAPVWIVSIYNEQIVFVGATSGTREDIAKAYPQSVADNVVISGAGPPVDCRTGQKVITLAVSMRHQFGIIGRSDIEGCR
jgi:hypothetical protein